MRTFILAAVVFGMLTMPRVTFGETVPSPAILISEVAWSGSSLSDADEWFELANLSDAPIDLSGWYIEGAAAANSIVLNSGSIPAHGTFLVSNYDRGNAKSVLDVSPNFVSSSVSLSNSSLHLVLKDASGVILDEVSGTSAGTSGAVRASMERETFATWRTATEASGLLVTGSDFGTPGTHVVILSETKDHDEPPILPDASAEPQHDNTSTTPDPPPLIVVNPPVDPSGYAEHDVIITEFSTRDDEWVEYRNETDDPITLDGFVIEDDSGRRTSLSGVLTPHSYGVARAASGTLNNDGDVLRLRDRTGRILDEVGYGKTTGFVTAPGEGQVAARTKVSTKSNSDFSLTTFPTPGSVNVIVKPKAAVTHATTTTKASSVVPKPEKPTLALASTEISGTPIIAPKPRIRISGPTNFYAQQSGVFTATLTRAGSGNELIEWFLDDAYLGSGESVSVIADAGSYKLRAELEADDGSIVEASRSVKIKDFPTPAKSSVPGTAKRSTSSGSKLGVSVVASGIVTAGENIAGVRKVFLENGMTVYLKSGKLPVIAPGDIVRAVGTRSTDGLTLNVKTAANIQVVGKGNAEPVLLDGPGDDSLKHQLVTISGTVERLKGKNFTLAGDESLEVYWKSGASLPAGLVQNGAELAVSGILTVRSNQWTVIPRGAEDIKVLKPAPPGPVRYETHKIGNLGNYFALGLVSLFAGLAGLHFVRQRIRKTQSSPVEYEVETT